MHNAFSSVIELLTHLEQILHCLSATTLTRDNTELALMLRNQNTAINALAHSDDGNDILDRAIFVPDCS